MPGSACFFLKFSTEWNISLRFACFSNLTRVLKINFLTFFLLFEKKKVKIRVGFFVFDLLSAELSWV